MIEKYTEFLTGKLEKVSTARLSKFLGIKSEDRDEMIPSLAKGILNDDLFKDRFIKSFGRYIGLRGVDFDKLVGCSREERKFWLDTGKLNVLYYTTYPKMDGEYPVYDAFQAIYEIPSKLEEWKEEYKKYKLQKRKEYKESEEYKQKKSLRNEGKEEIKQLKEFWKSLPDEKALSLEIAYFLRLANHWAKTDSVRRETTIDIYAIKNSFVSLLQHSSLASLYFYRPECPDKIIYERDYFGEPDESECYIEHDYYSLYFLEIAYEEIKYSFHTPYPIGKEFFPKPDNIPEIDHSEDESYDGPRFGRGMFDDEKIMYPRATVMNRLNKLLPIAIKTWKK